jgi:hypothetical protein
MGLQKNGIDKSCLIFCDFYNLAKNKSKILTILIYMTKITLTLGSKRGKPKKLPKTRNSERLRLR